MCWFPWCKCSHHGQATNVNSLDTELRRDVNNWLPWANETGSSSIALDMPVPNSRLSEPKFAWIFAGPLWAQPLTTQARAFTIPRVTFYNQGWGFYLWVKIPCKTYWWRKSHTTILFYTKRNAVNPWFMTVCYLNIAFDVLSRILAQTIRDNPVFWHN